MPAPRAAENNTMKKLFLSVSLAGLFLSGCVFINLPKQEPLVEKVVAGKGGAKVLLVNVTGIITSDERRGALGIGAKPNRLSLFKEELDLAANDKDIKAVVVVVNSPGGTVTACDVMHHELKNFRDKRKGVPVITEMVDFGASGGYYIATATDKILAHPTTITGSIGVIAYNLNASGLMEKLGISDQTVKSGDKKDIGSPLRSMTEEERKILQSGIDSLYERFLSVIKEGRPGLAALPAEELKKIADGRIYTADQALKLKLIDKIGYTDDAIEFVKGLAGIKEATVVTYAPPRAYKNNIYSMTEEEARLNLINIDGSSFADRFGMSFMYLWAP